LVFGLGKKPRIHVPWTAREEKTLFSYFSVNLKEEYCPGRAEVMKFTSQHPTFANRDWQTIKAKIFNTMNQRRRRLKKGLDE